VSWFVSLSTLPLVRRDDNAFPDLSPAAQKRTRERQSLNPLRTVSTILNGEPLLRLLALSLFLHAILFMGLIGTIGTYLAEYMGFGNYELAYVTGTCASPRLWFLQAAQLSSITRVSTLHFAP
jgi:hypothetical protein